MQLQCKPHAQNSGIFTTASYESGKDVGCRVYIPNSSTAKSDVKLLLKVDATSMFDAGVNLITNF